MHLAVVIHLDDQTSCLDGVVVELILRAYGIRPITRLTHRWRQIREEHGDIRDGATRSSDEMSLARQRRERGLAGSRCRLRLTPLFGTRVVDVLRTPLVHALRRVDRKQRRQVRLRKRRAALIAQRHQPIPRTLPDTMRIRQRETLTIGHCTADSVRVAVKRRMVETFSMPRRAMRGVHRLRDGLDVRELARELPIGEGLDAVRLEVGVHRNTEKTPLA